jgi:hypothetical protein
VRRLADAATAKRLKGGIPKPSGITRTQEAGFQACDKALLSLLSALTAPARPPHGRDDRPVCSYDCPLSEIKFLEEIIALVVDHDESGEVFDLDSPDRFHTEFGIFDDLNSLDAILG